MLMWCHSHWLHAAYLQVEPIQASAIERTVAAAGQGKRWHYLALDTAFQCAEEFRWLEVAHCTSEANKKQTILKRNVRLCLSQTRCAYLVLSCSSNKGVQHRCVVVNTLYVAVILATHCTVCVLTGSDRQVLKSHSRLKGSASQQVWYTDVVWYTLSHTILHEKPHMQPFMHNPKGLLLYWCIAVHTQHFFTWLLTGMGLCLLFKWTTDECCYCLHR